MAPPLLLYSTNTLLAYGIAQEYYAEQHWVWCNTTFRAPRDSNIRAPASAQPGEIYDRLFEDVTSGDRHSGWIKDNKRSVLRGAKAKLAAGVITPQQFADIRTTVRKAEVADFFPLLYVILYSRVKTLIKKVPPAKRAHPLSPELHIEALPRSAFDILYVRG